MSVLSLVDTAVAAAEDSLVDSRAKLAEEVLPEIEQLGEQIAVDAKRIADLAKGADIDPHPESPCSGSGANRPVIAHFVSCPKCGAEWSSFSFDAARIPPHTGSIV